MAEYSLLGNQFSDQLQPLRQGIATIPGVTSPTADTHYGQSIVVTHNFGFAPVYLAWAYVPMIDWYGTQKYNQFVFMPQGIQENSITTTAGNFYYLGMLSDSTTITFYNNAYTHGTPTDIPDMPVKYVLFGAPTTSTS